MGFAKPIEQYLVSNLLTKIHVFMYLKDIIRGEIRMGKNAIEAIHDDGIAEGDTLHRILLIMKKIQKGKTLATIAYEIEKEEKDILPIYTMIKDHPNESKEEIYKLLQAN